MAQTSKDTLQGRRFTFTRKTVDTVPCEAGKSQTIYWDADQPGLGLRVTAKGARAFIFESKLGRETIRMTIGPASMQIRAAKDKRGVPLVVGADTQAAAWAALVAQGRDPRAVKAEATAADQALREDARRQTVTAREAWDVYLQERRPKWGERHYEDHVIKGEPGGTLGKRGKPLQAGVLAPLLSKPLHELDAATVEAWAAREAKTRPTVARLAWRLLKAFLGWCAEQPAYAAAVADKNAAKSKRARESLGKPGTKSDALQREQLKAWFAAVQAIHNPVVAAYCQAVLLTGARPGEVLAMRWEDLNGKWKGLTIRDKVEGERTIPLTPYVEHILAALPRRNAFVFSGVRGAVVAAPNELHATACKVAGIEGMTLHGLRRSFKSLTEWLDIPAGVVAQLMGHKPSATAERHYTVRPLDLLRVHHERIEAWMLEQAEIEFDAKAATAAAGLRVVPAAA
jgi:integrase